MLTALGGKRVAIAEEFRVGGTCVIRGCVPKKLLVYGAHFAEDLKDARKFGWDVPDCRFDWDVLRDNVLAEVDRLEGLYGQTLDNHKVTVFRTRATVTGPQKIRRADGQELTARKSGDSILLTSASGNKAIVTQADVEQANGVVHVIDAVLLPRM